VLAWRRAEYEFRWWLWFTSGPSIFTLFSQGLDKSSLDIIEQRWLDAEPAFYGIFPHRQDLK
jgi:hypothetical protein